MSIDFNQIPVTLNRPGTRVEFDFTGALQGLPKPNVRILLTGQKTGSGSAANATPQRILSADHARTLYGPGSQLALMAKGWFAQSAAKGIEVWGCAAAEAGGAAAATATFAFTGPATANGTFAANVCGLDIRIGVTSGMTATQLGDAFAAAITAATDLPCTAADVSGTVTLTAKCKGVEGNFLFLAVNFRHGDVLPAGIGCTLTGFASGATNAAASDVITAIGNQPFYAIVSAWSDATNVAAIETALSGRADASKMNYGFGLIHHPGSYSQLTTAAASRNSALVALTGCPFIPESAPQVAGAVAAQVVASAVVDPARPFHTLVLAGISAPRLSQRLGDDERDLLIGAGIATLRVNGASQVAIERLVTTYKTNANGFTDARLKDLNKILTHYALAWTLQQRIDTRFPRHKLVDDGTNALPGANAVTPTILKGEVIALAREWEEAAWIEDVDQLIADLVIERNANDTSRADAILRPNPADAFNSFAVVIQPSA